MNSLNKQGSESTSVKGSPVKEGGLAEEEEEPESKALQDSEEKASKPKQHMAKPPLKDNFMDGKRG